jgi:hypothetical protein
MADFTIYAVARCEYEYRVEAATAKEARRKFLKAAKEGEESDFFVKFADPGVLEIIEVIPSD